MGWRGQEAYEREAPTRYSWRGLIVFAVIVALAGVYLWAKFVH